MATNTPNGARPLLQSLEEDWRRQQGLVDHIRGLLARADERRAAEPNNLRKWNKVLDNLEVALNEAKAKLEHCRRRYEDERRRYDGTGEGQPPPTVQEHSSGAAGRPNAVEPPVTRPRTPADPAEEAAAQYLLSTPLDHVEHAPLEQVALAQNYLTWRRAGGISDGEDQRLAGRIELAIQGSGGESGESRESQERRRQQALRVVVDRIVAGAVDTLTLRDLDLAAGCYTVLCRKPDLDPSERRLQELLHGALEEAERTLENLRLRPDGRSNGT